MVQKVLSLVLQLLLLFGDEQKEKVQKTSNTEEEVPKATEYSKDNGKVQL